MGMVKAVDMPQTTCRLPKAHRPRVRCRASNGGPAGRVNKPTEPAHSERAQVYPPLEGSDDLDTLFPLRQPGNFPYAGKGEPQPHAAPVAIRQDAASFDPLRDGPLRYLGYANECGEAFAAWLPPVGVPASYAIAIGYVLVDTFDKAAAAQREASASLGLSNSSSQPVRPAASAGDRQPPATVADLKRVVALLTSERLIDTLLWQMLASVILPGFTIHQVVHFMHLGLSEGLHLDDLSSAPASVQAAVSTLAAIVAQQPQQLSALLERGLPTAAGLAAIPFIVHPIDNAVHLLLNMTLRPAMKRAICDGGGGRAAGLDMCLVSSSSDDEEPHRYDGKGEGDTAGRVGKSVSSFDYAACLEAENCSVVQEYRVHRSDAAATTNPRRAVAKALMLTLPVALALLAAVRA